MSALILLAVVCVLVAVLAPIARCGLRAEGRTRTVTLVLRPDVEAFTAAMLAVGQSAARAAESMRSFGAAWMRAVEDLPANIPGVDHALVMVDRDGRSDW